MTAQIHEILIEDGESMGMAFCPPLPEGHPRIARVSDRELWDNDEDAILISTACLRGYQGSWEIRDGRFYLVELRGRLALRGDGPLLADWFSGVLKVPRGEQLQYVHAGFGSVYEREVQISIENGVVAGRRVIDHRGEAPDP